MENKVIFSLWMVFAEGDSVFSASTKKSDIINGLIQFQTFREQGFMQDVKSIRAEVRSGYNLPEVMPLDLDIKTEDLISELRNFLDQYIVVPEGDFVYKTLKMIERGIKRITNEDLGIPKRDFIEHMTELQDDGLISNLGLSKGGGEIRGVETGNLRLTKAGKQHIDLVESGKI